VSDGVVGLGLNAIAGCCVCAGAFGAGGGGAEAAGRADAAAVVAGEAGEASLQAAVDRAHALPVALVEGEAVAGRE